LNILILPQSEDSVGKIEIAIKGEKEKKRKTEEAWAHSRWSY
jgi:hypothetical protein